MVDLCASQGQRSIHPCLGRKHSHPMLRPSGPDSDGTPVPPALHVAQLELSFPGLESRRQLEARVGMYLESKAQREIGMLSLGR
jgi:hypothetical protein